MNTKKYFIHNPILCFLLVILIIGCSDWNGKSGANAELPNTPDEITPLKIGDKIPDLILKDIYGIEYNLVKALKKKPTILIYYRGGWCLYCNQHLGQIQKIEQDIFDLGYQIIAVGADISGKITETIQKHSIHYTIISDSSMDGAKALGIAYYAGDIYKDMLGILEEYSGRNHHVLPVPSVFIVNQEGIVQFTYINPDFRIRIAPELLMTAARVALEE